LTQTKIAVNGLMLIGSADRTVQHESNRSKPYSWPTSLIQRFGKIGWASGQSVRTPDTAQQIPPPRSGRLTVHTYCRVARYGGS